MNVEKRRKDLYEGFNFLFINIKLLQVLGSLISFLFFIISDFRGVFFLIIACNIYVFF